MAILYALLLLISMPVAAVSPNVLLKDLAGEYRHLNEYIGLGKWVVLNVWGPRCPPCIDEIPELEEFHQENSKTGAIVLGVAIDFPSFGYAKRDEVAQFVDDYFVTYPILLADGKTITRLGAGRLQGTPTSMLFRPDGKLVAVQVGTVTREILEKFIKSYKK